MDYDGPFQGHPFISQNANDLATLAFGPSAAALVASDYIRKEIYTSTSDL